MKTKIAALVILYNFNEKNVSAITSYINLIDKVYVFDNSRNSPPKLVKKFKNFSNVEYISVHKNLGLSIPINTIARKALKDGFQWLITFDQDSFVTENMLPTMLNFIENLNNKNEIGIISPLIDDGKLDFSQPISEFSYFDKVIQSGALHNLYVWKKIGGYDENLFIDQVDYEYCIRLILNGYNIIRLNKAILKHNFEDSKTKVDYINGKKIVVNKYNAYRYYYIFRNNLYCWNKYRKIYPPYASDAINNIHKLLKGILYESKKKNKIKAILFGGLDYFMKKMGKCRRNF